MLRDTTNGSLREIAPGRRLRLHRPLAQHRDREDLVATDDSGFIITDVGLQTSVPGIFAAGDVRAGSTKQAASAAGEGAAAALAIRRYVDPFAGGMPRSANIELAHG